MKADAFVGDAVALLLRAGAVSARDHMVDVNLDPSIEVKRSHSGVARRGAVVALALVLGDLVTGLSAGLIADFVVYGWTSSTSTGHFDLLLYIACCFTFGLYGRRATSPYERLRLRLHAVLLFIGIKLGSGYLAGGVGHELPYLAIRATLLLLIGFYVEHFVIRGLTQVGLWESPMLIVGSAREPGGSGAQPPKGLEPGALPAVAIRSMEENGGQLGGIATVALRETAHFDAPERPAEAAIHNGPAYRETGGTIYSATRPYGLLKRAIDLAVAVPAALLLLPLVGLMVLAIKVIDPGPAFYVQRRVGRDGSHLRIFKIRSMYVDADQRLQEHLRTNAAAQAEWLRYFKLRDDPRILSHIGHFLRRSSLDELPQLWNVICGEMTLVGPRPLPDYHAASFDAEFQRIRASVTPGLTGLCQVMARRSDLAMQKAHDLFYIQNRSIWLDLYILLQTVPAVLSGNGAR